MESLGLVLLLGNGIESRLQEVAHGHFLSYLIYFGASFEQSSFFSFPCVNDAQHTCIDFCIFDHKCP